MENERVGGMHMTICYTGTSNVSGWDGRGGISRKTNPKYSLGTPAKCTEIYELPDIECAVLVDMSLKNEQTSICKYF